MQTGLGFVLFGSFPRALAGLSNTQGPIHAASLIHLDFMPHPPLKANLSA